ncbi:GntR family transcriptional regulator [Paraglaciecola chathamensis]|uniref:GntR family transcriptional regulator, vanillate catabolism transcriptional regulator n=1 Tax=Paraglaciecola agarilytica NO2 TaxID=1125747 RepID=A0ABQ0I256_9ALTE|nr:GntR family transcriptional regulator [Paraglaciecola agarilytica]GAC03420.1 GntR family transcriptional regulator, vanillate catabolism transcriptional regulator [Paraglaciecola agarilytica NO2]
MAREGQAVVSILRDKIVSGEFPAGERLAEIPTAALLGISRTPIRIAFRALEQEGLLIKLPRRGYMVRKVTPQEISGAIEVRGVLEGLAARLAAEKGLEQSTIEQLKECLLIGDALFIKGHINQKDIESYNILNKRFHDLILQSSGNPAILSALHLNEHLPFASVTALAFNPSKLEREFRRFNYAHMQHHAIFEALVKQQGARSEAIMREHANATLSYAELFDVYSSYKLVDKS